MNQLYKNINCKTDKSSGDDEENLKESQIIGRNQNQRLFSPGLKKLIAKKDASVMLKEEIGESTLRMKAAKFGHPIAEIVP